MDITNLVDDNLAEEGAMLRALGAPDTITVLSDAMFSSHLGLVASWNDPDWMMFEQQCRNKVHLHSHATAQHHSDPHIKTSSKTNQFLKIVLSIESIPVPKSVIVSLLASNPEEAIDEQSLLIAFRQSYLTNDVLLHLLHHITQYPMNDHHVHHTNDDLVTFASTKLLHECAKMNCLEGARALIEFFPNSLDCTDVMGLRPLHSAFSYQNQSVKRSDMVRLLIQEGMKNSIGGEDGCGGIFLERSTVGSGGSPFELSLYYLRQANARGEDCDDQWKCLTACLEASKMTNKDFQLVNYIINLRIGSERVLPKVVEQYHIDLNCGDENGMTPLLVAIQMQKSSYIKSLLSIQNCALEQIRSCNFNGKCYNDRLPLHFAVDVGITWSNGLKEVIESNEGAVGILDQETGLYPFMLAAQHKNNPLHDTYQILRCNPSVLEHFDGSSKKHQYSSLFGLEWQYIHIVVGVILGIIVFAFKSSEYISS